MNTMITAFSPPNTKSILLARRLRCDFPYEHLGVFFGVWFFPLNHKHYLDASAMPLEHCNNAVSGKQTILNLA